MSEVIGMMDKSYFVGKREILQWINSTLECNIEKVEDAHTGWVYCQLVDSLYPGQVPLHRVNFNAKNEYEKIQNYKILQDAFSKFNISRAIFVEKLVKGKFQDNMEFCQWLKGYHSAKFSGPYDGAQRREAAMASYSAGHKHAPKTLQPAPSTASVPTSAAAAPVSRPKAEEPKSVVAPKRIGSAATSKAAASGAEDYDSKLAEQTQKIAKLRLAVEGLEKERDFYFGKLREIEILCQAEEEADIKNLKQKILDILYATDENDEFRAPEDAAAQ